MTQKRNRGTLHHVPWEFLYKSPCDRRLSSVLPCAPWEFLYNSLWDRSSNVFYVKYVVERWCRGKKVAERGNPLLQIQEWVYFNCLIFWDRQRMNKNSHSCMKASQWQRWRQKGIHRHSCLLCYRSSIKLPHQACLSFQKDPRDVLWLFCCLALFFLLLMDLKTATCAPIKTEGSFHCKWFLVNREVTGREMEKFMLMDHSEFFFFK